MSDALDDAAAAALWMLSLEQDPRREHIGLLYETPAGLERTPTRDTGDTRRAGGTFAIPSGSLRGLFHNHPPREFGRGARGAEDDERATFSGDDALQARTLGVPSYISADNNRVLKYDPSSKKTDEVLAEFPMEEFRAYLMHTLLDRSADDPRGLMR